MGVFDFFDELADSLVDVIRRAIEAVADFINRIFVEILRFFENIVDFFQNIIGQDEEMREKIRQQEVLAISIKQHLENGNYQVINCLFNRETGTIVEPRNRAKIIDARRLDQKTKDAFADKDMLVLR